MSSERWDVVVQVLDGPMAGDEQTIRGPVAPLGSNPGPEGLSLRGYRGLEAKHAVITVYDEGQATLSPIGTSQVRVAPHPHVRWTEIGPLGGPAHLSEGCAIHLGPVGRGATLQFQRCARLGAWAPRTLASTAHPTGVGGGAPLRARRVSADNATVVKGLGCLVLLSTSVVTAILVGLCVGPPQVEELGPTTDGESYYEFVRVDPDHQASPVLHEGVAQAFQIFVMDDNATAAGRSFPQATSWDQRFYDHTERSVELHLKSWAVFRRLDDVRDDYARVLAALRAANLPDAMAAIPYLESRYRSELQSGSCAKGLWQWMPEAGPRFSRAGLDFTVADCRFRNDEEFLYSPSALTPPVGVYKNADYIARDDTLPKNDPKQCRIRAKSGCRVDSRTDFQASTAAAVLALGEAFTDPDIRASGAAVQIAIGSHYAGYDDAPLGVPKSYNMLPAYLAWREGKPRREWREFYGANLLCDANETEAGGDWCGSALTPGSQHYAYTVIAQHILAACYYGLNYGSEPEFASYARLSRDTGYCTSLGIPTTEEVRRTRH